MQNGIEKTKQAKKNVVLSLFCALIRGVCLLHGDRMAEKKSERTKPPKREMNLLRESRLSVRSEIVVRKRGEKLSSGFKRVTQD